MGVVHFCDICGKLINESDYRVVKLECVTSKYIRQKYKSSTVDITPVRELCDDCAEAIINYISELSITNHVSKLGRKESDIEKLYLVDAYRCKDYNKGWHENVGVYSTLEKAIESGNMYMRREIEKIKKNSKFANEKPTYEEITFDNWKPYRRYKYDSIYDYTGIEIITRELDFRVIND